MSYSSVSITAGSGTAVSTDSISSKEYQIVKLFSGKEGSTAYLGHVEDDAHTSADAGIMALAVRKDTAATTAGTDGDYCPLVSDSSGRLHVNVGNTVTVGSHAVTNAGTFAVQVDGAALTALQLLDDVVFAEDVASQAADKGIQILAVRKDTAAAIAGTDGDYAPLEVDANGCLHVLVNGTVTVGSHAVTNAGTFAVQAAQSGTWNITNISGTISLPTGASTLAEQQSQTTALQLIDNLVLAEDAVHGSGDPGVQALAVRKDTAAALAGADGDYAPLEVDANGRLHTIEPSAATIATNTGNATTALQIMDDWDNAASDGASVSGDVAHDAVDAGEPVKIGAKAETSPKGITLVSDADRTDLLADADGMLMVKLGTSGADHISEAVSNTDGVSTAFTNFAAVASTKAAITSIAVFRTDAGSSLAYVDFRDGTGGAVLWRMPLPPNGGSVLSLAGQPIFKTSANTALAFDVSSALTTVYISVSGFYTKV